MLYKYVQKHVKSKEQSKAPPPLPVATMVVEIQDDSKQKQEVKPREWSNLISFSFKTTILGHIFKKSTHSFFGPWSFLLTHIRFAPIEGPKDF